MGYDDHRAQLLRSIPVVSHGLDLPFIKDLWKFQIEYNHLYQNYCQDLGCTFSDIASVEEIPFLPISAFKHHDVMTGSWKKVDTFLSSGTSSTLLRSHHFVRDLDFYHDNSKDIWTHQYGDIGQYAILALLPGYLEREGSSLISMVSSFIETSGSKESGFYLRDHQSLLTTLRTLRDRKIPTVLFGVSYALLDFIDQYEIDFPSLILFETGGMKGKRPEMTKVELHEKLKRGFGTSVIHSEYGMTELLSQSYSKGSGIFMMHSRLRVVITQINDPLTPEKIGKSGIVNLIDLANIDTCSFIQTQDLGIDHGNNTFSILGRLDVSDIRGCNLMIDELS